VTYAPNLGWRGVPLGSDLAEQFSVPVVVENDVRAAAWGEFRFGAGRDVRSLIAVFVGTGVGGGLVIDGALWHGATNAAGEIGHTQVVPDGRVCPCGGRGCLEQYASGGGFQRRFRDALDEGIKTILTERTHREPATLTAPMVAAAAGEGDDFAREVWADAERYLTLALANAITLINPNLVVLGGGVIESVPRLFDTVVERIPVLTTTLGRSAVPIARTELGDWSGVVGAAARAARHLLS